MKSFIILFALGMFAIYSGWFIVGLFIMLCGYGRLEAYESEQYYKSEWFARVHPEQYAEMEKARIKGEKERKEAKEIAVQKEIELYRSEIQRFEEFCNSQ